jgi:hypothetical protein
MEPVFRSLRTYVCEMSNNLRPSMMKVPKIVEEVMYMEGTEIYHVWQY